MLPHWTSGAGEPEGAGAEGSGEGLCARPCHAVLMPAAGPMWSRLQAPRLGTSGSFPLLEHSTGSMMVMPCCMWDHIPWVSCLGCPGESVHLKVLPDCRDNLPQVCMQQRGNPFQRDPAAWEREGRACERSPDMGRRAAAAPSPGSIPARVITSRPEGRLLPRTCPVFALAIWELPPWQLA